MAIKQDTPASWKEFKELSDNEITKLLPAPYNYVNKASEVIHGLKLKIGLVLTLIPVSSSE